MALPSPAGRDDVLTGWELVLKSASPGTLRIQVSDVRTAVSREQAFVTCLELVETDASRGRVVATNIYERQEGRWKIIHHHGSAHAL